MRRKLELSNSTPDHKALKIRPISELLQYRYAQDHTSQFIWLYPWPVNSTILRLVLSLLENCRHASLLGTGQSEAFQVPMLGSWQVTRKFCKFCHNCVWRKICRAPSPMLYIHYICIKNCKTWKWSAYEYDKYAKICTPTLLMVPCHCKWAWVLLGWLWFCSGTLCGRGYGGWFSSSTGQRSGRYVHPGPVAAGQSEFLLYRHAQDHR